MASAILAAIPLGARADHENQGDARGDDRVAEGCQIPGSANGLGDTLAVLTLITCR